MKKWILLSVSLLLVIFLTACGDNNDANNNNQNTGNSSLNDNKNDDTADTSSNSEDDMQTKMEQLEYKEIEVEVDYGQNNEYEVEIEQDEGQPIRSKIEDEVNDEFLKGEEAFNKLYPMVKDLSIDKNTDKDDAIQEVLNTFNLEDNYDEFELEITLNDGKKLEYEDK